MTPENKSIENYLKEQKKILKKQLEDIEKDKEFFYSSYIGE